MTIKISQLANLTVVQANTIVPVVSNITSTLTTVQANVQQLQTYMLENAGNLIPRAGNIYSIGNSTTWWKDLWLSANTLYIGGVPIGTAGGELTFGGNAVGTSGLDTYTGNVSASNISVGSTTVFPAAPGAGVTGTYSNPYQLTLTENVIYIQSDYVSSAPGDAGFTTGFFFYATTGSGATASDIPAGFTVTLIDTATSSGSIATGVTGPGLQYYTGFNTADGQYTSPEFTTTANQYKSALTLMWEPRIAQSDASEKGSWVVLSATSNWNF